MDWERDVSNIYVQSGSGQDIKVLFDPRAFLTGLVQQIQR